VAAIGIVVFLTFYVWAASTLAEYVPDATWAKLAYFAVVGLAWGFPLFPLIAWAERGGKRKASE